MVPESFYMGLIYVFMIAFIMIFFETIFFLVIVRPQETHIFKDKIQALNSGVLEGYNVDYLIDYLTVGDVREKALMHSLNTDSIIFIMMECALFLMVVLFCCYKSTSNLKGFWEKWNKLRGIICLAGLTTIILITFQIIMYIYAGGLHTKGSFEYPGDDEINLTIVETYKKELNL